MNILKSQADKLEIRGKELREFQRWCVEAEATAAILDMIESGDVVLAGLTQNGPLFTIQEP